MNTHQFFYLYKITNLINNKVYIGQTVEPKKRWYGHRRSAANPKMSISRAIKKYGNDAFQFEIIATCRNIDDSNYLEEELIKQYGSFVDKEKGYNDTSGGHNNIGKKYSEESKKRMSLAHKGQHSSPATEFKPGIHYSKETEFKAGSKHTEEWKQHMSEVVKNQWINGERKQTLGSELVKQNQKAAMKKFRKLTEAQELEVIEKYASNASVRSISKEYLVAHAVISSILKRNNITIRQGVAWNKDKKDLLHGTKERLGAKKRKRKCQKLKKEKFLGIKV